ncbi:MAG: phosphonate ABC transporter substrate-binding protein, partial [Burkholderiales bacterium PBB5]
MSSCTRLLGSLVLGLAATALQAQEINFGVIATDSASTQRERWEPFFADMAKKTGLTIKSFYAPDYAGVIEAMRFNKVQVAWMGNKAAMEAVDRSSGEVFAQVMYADGTFGYHGLLVAHKASPYNNVDDVLAKQVDVATNNTEDLTKLESSKPELASQVKVLWKSPLIPSDPFVWRKDLDPAVKAKLKTFVLGYAKTDPAEKAILKNIYSYGGFRESSNDQLIP